MSNTPYQQVLAFFKSKINPDTGKAFNGDQMGYALYSSRERVKEHLNKKWPPNSYRRLLAVLYFKFGYDISLLDDSYREIIKTPLDLKLSPVDSVLHLQPVTMKDGSEDLVFSQQFRKLNKYIKKSVDHFRMYSYLRNYRSSDSAYLQRSFKKFYHCLENQLAAEPGLKYTLNLALPYSEKRRKNFDRSEYLAEILKSCFPETLNHIGNCLKKFPSRAIVSILTVPPRQYDYFTVDELYIVSIDYLVEENGEMVPDLILAGKNFGEVSTNFRKHKIEIDKRTRAFQLLIDDLLQ